MSVEEVCSLSTSPLDTFKVMRAGHKGTYRIRFREIRGTTRALCDQHLFEDSSDTLNCNVCLAVGSYCGLGRSRSAEAGQNFTLTAKPLCLEMSACYDAGMPRRVGDYRGLTEESRIRLLHAVQRQPARPLKELADEADLHINTARDHLRVLEAEGFVHSAPVDTGRRGRPPMGFWPVQRSENSPAAQQRADEAAARGAMLRRIDPELDHSASLDQDAQHQLDVLYEHLEDAGMEPVINAEELTVGVKPCIYQDLLESERTVVCAVHAKLVRQQLDQVDGPLKLRKLHPFTTGHSCLLVLGADDRTEATPETNAPGIDGDRTDAELQQFALEAQRRVSDNGHERDCQQ